MMVRMQNADLNSVLADAERLSDEDRIRLTQRLLSALDGPPDPQAEADWSAEIARRSAEIERGEVTPIPWSELREAVTRKLGGDRP